jgi:hypothetical protein
MPYKFTESRRHKFAKARFRPVLHLERHLRDVAAVGVVFVWHRDNPNQRGESILPSLDRSSAPTPQNRPVRAPDIG